MALPSSGAINLLQICAEYGAGAGTAMTSLVRGGGIVPNTGPNAGIPTTPPIGMTQFYGGSGTAGLAANKSGDAVGYVFQAEPAPPNATVTSNSVSIFASGGTGSYSYSWAYVSGDASISIIGGTSGPTKSWTRSVGKGNTATATWRCTVNDGANSVQVNVAISLTYETNI